MCENHGKIFLNCERMCDLKDLSDSKYDKKPQLDLLTLSMAFYNLSVSCNLFSQAEMRQFGANAYETVGNRRVKCSCKSHERAFNHANSWYELWEKLRRMLLEEHELETWLSKQGPIVAYAEYYIGLCKNYNWDKRVFNIWNKTLKNMGRVKRIRF